tara:strand:- start:79 stop:927 length:849 start_codon:yes stop_codon:yes gene_type:complete
MKTIISFSGGKTSAYMTWLLIQQTENKEDLVVLFANTGQEHPKTLEFINKCDELLGFNTIWLEAVVHHDQRVACTHKVTNYKECDKKGDVFEEVIKKYGLPNKSYKHCNRELKINPIESYRKAQKLREAKMAIGIRADEIDRVSLAAMTTRKVFYPLADAGKTQEDVNQFWRNQTFTLDIPDYMGNCVTCFKKSNRKLLTIADDEPKWFDFTARMEKLYSHVGSNRDEGRAFYRSHKTTLDVLNEASEPFTRYKPDTQMTFDLYYDQGGGCGSSCEVYTDEN